MKRQRGRRESEKRAKVCGERKTATEKEWWERKTREPAKYTKEGVRNRERVAPQHRSGLYLVDLQHLTLCAAL